MVLRGRDSDPAAALGGSQSKAPGFAGGTYCSRGICSKQGPLASSCSRGVRSLEQREPKLFPLQILAGRITNVQTDPRAMEFALKFVW